MIEGREEEEVEVETYKVMWDKILKPEAPGVT